MWSGSCTVGKKTQEGNLWRKGMLEMWTVQFTVETESYKGMCKDHKLLYSEILNNDFGLIVVFEDGLHFHHYLICDRPLKWTLIRRDCIKDE